MRKEGGGGKDGEAVSGEQRDGDSSGRGLYLSMGLGQLLSISSPLYPLKQDGAGIEHREKCPVHFQTESQSI